MAEAQKSRFWAEESSSSEEDSSDSSSDEEQETTKTKKQSKWEVESDGSDYDDNRVVRTAVEKAKESLSKIAKTLKNNLNNNDWSSADDEFKKLQKEEDKAIKVNNQKHLSIYLLAVKNLHEVIIEIHTADKKDKPKLSKRNGKAFNILRARVT